MLVDYFIIRRGNLQLPDLFRTSPSGRYYFTKGFNIRALIAFVAGFLLPLPGFVASFGHKLSDAATNMFALGWVLSFTVGGTAYWVICFIFKVPGDDGTYSFEEKVADAEEMIVRGGTEYKPSEEDEKPRALQSTGEIEQIERSQASGAMV